MYFSISAYSLESGVDSTTDTAPAWCRAATASSAILEEKEQQIKEQMKKRGEEKEKKMEYEDDDLCFLMGWND